MKSLFILVLIAVFALNMVSSCYSGRKSLASTEVASSAGENQVKLSPFAKQLVRDLEQESLGQTPFAPSGLFQDKYPLEELDGVYYLRATIKVGPDFNQLDAEQLGVRFNPPAGNIITLMFPVNRLPELIKLKGIEYFDYYPGGAPTE